MKVEIFTEVSKRKSTGLAFGYVVINDKVDNEFYNQKDNVDHNLLEMEAIIQGFEILSKSGAVPDRVIVYTPSKNIILAFQDDWISKWKRNNWVNSSKKPVKYKEQWEKIYDYYVEYLPELRHSSIYKKKKVGNLAKKTARKYTRKNARNV